MATYRVRPGDTINDIIAMTGMTREQFLRLNPNVTNPRQLQRAGTVRLGAGVRITTNTWNQYQRQVWEEERNPTVETRDLGIQAPILREPEGHEGPFTAREFSDAGINSFEPIEGPNVPGVGDTIPGQSPLDPTNPTPSGEISQGEAARIRAGVEGAFPWVTAMGLGAEIENWIRFEGLRTSSELVARLRDTEQWRTMFPNIRRDDNTLRMNEGDWLRQMDRYRDTLDNFGFMGQEYSNLELSNFLANDIDVNELGDRLTIWDQLVRGGADLKMAFYVYGGISMSDEDLFNYVVDPGAQAEVDDEYAANAGSVDYPTFIGRVADIVANTSGQAVDRDTSVALLDILAHGGDPVGGRFLSLAELTNAYEAALIASTATAQGLALPGIERIEEFRLAGINRTQALSQYGQFARDQNFLNAISLRSGGGGFTQEEFEDASFLSDPTATREMDRGIAQEEGRSKATGSFSFSQSQSGRLAQAGFSAFRN